MKRINLFSMLGITVLLSAAVVSCHVDDTNDESTAAVVTDTSMVKTEPAAEQGKMETEQGKMTELQPAEGMAKPNPAKKGMKGKVAVEETKTVKNIGKMEADETGVYSNVEVLPSFPGGYKGLQKYFDDNLEYPAEATNEGVEGTVNITFVVDENGKLTSPKVMGDKLGYGLETEALRVVNKMPVWNAGKLKGKNVKTNFTLPVRFVLY